MTYPEFSGKRILIVGGAGFVGSNLSHILLQSDLKSLTIVDNFMSSEESNIPQDPRIHFIQGSIAHDSVLAQIPEDIDFVWHLACYH